MKLLRFVYKEKDWELKEVNFQSVNLLVGKNASGKSKTIQSLNVVVAYLLQQKEISASDRFDFFLYFEKDEEFISYRVKCAAGVILFEIRFPIPILKRLCNGPNMYADSVLMKRISGVIRIRILIFKLMVKIYIP